MGIAFGISRPPLREALKALTLMGILQSRQGGRYTVTDLSPTRLAAPFNVMLSIGDYDVREAFRGAHRGRARSWSACAPNARRPSSASAS